MKEYREGDRFHAEGAANNRRNGIDHFSFLIEGLDINKMSGREMSPKISGKTKQPSGPGNGFAPGRNLWVKEHKGMNSSTVTGEPRTSQRGRTISHASHVDDRQLERQTYLLRGQAQPLWAYIVSSISPINFFKAGVMPPIFSPFWRRMGVP